MAYVWNVTPACLWLISVFGQFKYLNEIDLLIMLSASLLIAT